MSPEQASVLLHQAVPRSRYLLFLSALLLIPMAFLPWIAAKITISSQGYFGGSIVLASYNPIQIYSMLLGIPTYVTAVRLALVGGSCVPALLFSVWLHRPIQSATQRIGVLLYSIWLLLFSVANTYAILGVLYDRLILQRILGIQHVWFWHADSGVALWVLTQTLLWIVLVLLWREMPYSPTQYLLRMMRRRYTTHDAGVALFTLGCICWFIGFFGMYWYLPDGCFTPPLFGTPPYGIGSCVNRLDTKVGFVSVLTHVGIPSALVSSTLYWVLGITAVLGGGVLVALLSVRPIKPLPLPWVPVCVATILLLTGTSFIGVLHLASVYPDERMTSGFALTAAGCIMLMGGLAVQWRLSLGNARLSRH